MSKDEWLQRADEVLYQAKKTGRCRVCVEAN
jgi:PleD family two-component response regulator